MSVFQGSLTVRMKLATDDPAQRSDSSAIQCDYLSVPQLGTC